MHYFTLPCVLLDTCPHVYASFALTFSSPSTGKPGNYKQEQLAGSLKEHEEDMMNDSFYFLQSSPELETPLTFDHRNVSRQKLLYGQLHKMVL